MTGEVVTVQPSASRYGGTYGEILGEDGNYYVFSGSNVFRNFSSASLGATVRFEIIAHSYATNIDQLNKHKPNWTNHK